VDAAAGSRRRGERLLRSARRRGRIKPRDSGVFGGPRTVHSMSVSVRGRAGFGPISQLGASAGSDVHFGRSRRQSSSSSPSRDRHSTLDKASRFMRSKHAFTTNTCLRFRPSAIRFARAKIHTYIYIYIYYSSGRVTERPNTRLSACN